MHRWELKLICAAVALVVSVGCSFLPFLLTHINCRRKKNPVNSKNELNLQSDANNQNSPSMDNLHQTEPELLSYSKSTDNGSLTSAGVFRAADDPETGDSEDEGYSVMDLRILGLLMCFGGGVFFGTFLLHMLPEVDKILKDSLMEPHSIEYPITQLLIGAGFFMVLIVEELVTKCQQWRENKKAEKFGNEIQSHSSPNDSHLEISAENSQTKTDHHHHHDGGHHDHLHNTRSIVLVLALSLHHIFEGLSIGLQKNFSNVWHLTIAVLCHETAICFSMGLQFYKSDQNLSKKVFAILLIAASIMPFGIVIGLAISEANHGSVEPVWQNILNGVLQALACGTFIYVTFFEILCDELTDGRSSPLKLLMVALGFIFMALLSLIPETGDDVYDDDLQLTTGSNFMTSSRNNE